MTTKLPKTWVWAHCQRCRARLATAVSSPLDAFCCRDCYRIFYDFSPCIICREWKLGGDGAACARPERRAELAASISAGKRFRRVRPEDRPPRPPSMRLVERGAPDTGQGRRRPGGLASGPEDAS